MGRKLVVFDCDGVLLRYNEAYPKVWERAFGEKLTRVLPGAYHASNEYGIPHLTEEQAAHFFKHFDESVWRTMPAFEDAVEATQLWAAEGFTLVCVSSMPPEFEAARYHNLREVGIPIERVIATGRRSEYNPKKDVINDLAPAVFVEDLATNFWGVSPTIHRALIDRGQPDSPNEKRHMEMASTVHSGLGEFTKWWFDNRK